MTNRQLFCRQGSSYITNQRHRKRDRHRRLEMPGRMYVSGWTCRIDSGSAVRRPTISDTGQGSARSIAYRPSTADDDNSYEAIKARCLEEGALWEDPDFPPVKESLFYNQPPSAWPDIEWKRPHVYVFPVSTAVTFDLRIAYTSCLQIIIFFKSQ